MKMWKNLTTQGLFVLGLVPASFAMEMSTTEPTAPEITLTLVADANAQKDFIRIESSLPLTSPAVSVIVGKWTTLSASGSELVYQTSESFSLSENDVVKVSYWIEAGTFQGTLSAHVRTEGATKSRLLTFDKSSNQLRSRAAYDQEVSAQIQRQRQIIVAQQVSQSYAMPQPTQPSYLPQQSVVNAPAGSSSQEQLLNLINNYRQQNGLGPVSYNASLAMVDNSSHSKFRSSGMSGVTNWAPGTDPNQVFEMWKGSAGHRANMLAPGISQIGIGTDGSSTTLLGQGNGSSGMSSGGTSYGRRRGR